MAADIRSSRDVEPDATAKTWRGRFFEDLSVGDRFTSRIGRTVTEADNVWFTCLTMNTNQVHFNHAYAEATEFGRPLVNSCLTLALVTGLSVPDVSENAAANLGWSDVRIPAPVFVGDTLWARTEVLSLRPSRSRPTLGVVAVRTEGVNQHGKTTIEFERTFLLHRRSAAPRRPWTDHQNRGFWYRFQGRVLSSWRGARGNRGAAAV